MPLTSVKQHPCPCEVGVVSTMATAKTMPTMQSQRPWRFVVAVSMCCWCRVNNCNRNNNASTMRPHLKLAMPTCCWCRVNVFWRRVNVFWCRLAVATTPTMDPAMDPAHGSGTWVRAKSTQPSTTWIRQWIRHMDPNLGPGQKCAAVNKN